MWNLVQYYRQGRGHVRKGIPCQDKTFTLQENGVSVIVLADGAGSAKLSHKGAEMVTRTVGELMCQEFHRFFSEEDPKIVRETLFSVIEKRLNSLSSKLECDIQDLASTLLVVATTEQEYLIFHLGDGVIGYLENGNIKVASIPNNGEFCNTTVFTTSRGAESQIKLYKGKLNDISGFVAFSDGVETTLYNHQEKKINSGLQELFDDLVNRPISEVSESLNEMFDEICTHTIDDCSIVAMAKVPNTQPLNPDEQPTDTPYSPAIKRKLLVLFLFILVLIILAIITLCQNG